MAMSRDDKERRILYGVTVATVLGILIMFVAMATDYWVIIDIPAGLYRNSTNSYLIKHHSGLWRICRTEIQNNTTPVIQRDYCYNLKLFPSQQEVALDPEVDSSILHYSRSETAFAVISLLMMLVAHIFVFYSFKEPRYMFKRLAGGMHLITAACILVTAEVLARSVSYEKANLPKRIPTASSISYGFSYALAWVCFVIFLLAAIVFFICSRKRKGDKAPDHLTAIENEPVHIGRA